MSGSLIPITDEMRMIFKGHYNGTIESLQIILTSLKEKEYSKAQAVRLLRAELELSLVDADRIVMNATAWSDGKDGNEMFREAFIDAVTSGKSLDEVGGSDTNMLSNENKGFIRSDGE
ncbi:hypothetical protein [Niastella populi]|uniref:Uncharacterized protein n=1 Tax=Niastella populi TaxID=550983 RepID=A0A1V9FXC6_9BACT|nr:hypothetical protein [Niastella populi]OQP62974.1 hypothetical protein A4R26_17495 [Niastella populi]